MDDLISREALYQELVKLRELAEKRVIDTPTNSPVYMRYVSQMNERRGFEYRIADAPAVDAAPVVHARWEQRDEFDKYENTYTCSVCDEPLVLICGTPAENHMFYCPNCGARMDGRQGDG